MMSAGYPSNHWITSSALYYIVFRIFISIAFIAVCQTIQVLCACAHASAAHRFLHLDLVTNRDTMLVLISFQMLPVNLNILDLYDNTSRALVPLGMISFGN